MVLAPLVLLAVLFFALALAFVLEDMIKNIANVVRGITLVGGYLAGALDAIARAISSALGAIEHGIDGLIGAAWHLFASYLDRTWHQLEAQASLLAHLAELVGNGIYNISGLRGLVHGVLRTVHGIEAGVKTLEREYHGIEHRVKVLEHSIAGDIGNDVRSQVKALEKEVTGIESGVIPSLRSGIKTAEGEVTQLENFIKAIPGTNYLAWAAGIVASALGLASLSSFICNEFKNITNRGCSNLWGGLDNLLSLFIDGIILTNLCTIIPETVTFFGLVEGEITGLISQAADAFCAKPPSGWVTLDVAPSTRPPAQTFDPTTL